MKTPKISIIVPVYNVEKYIRQCVESLVNQTFKDIEIIFIDDCSTDSSLNIINDFAKRDKRIIILKHKNNGGMSAARNTGIKFAHAPYIMCCDSDDFYSPTMCEEMLNAIEKSGADIAMCGTNIIYETDKKLKQGDDEYYRIKYDGTYEVTNDIVNNSDVSVWNKICKKAFFDKYDIQYPFGLKYEDAYFFRVYMLWAKKITFINKKLHNYRRRSGSTMNQTFKRCDMTAADHLKISFKIFDYMNKHNKYEENRDYFWKSIFIPYFIFAKDNSGKEYQKQICAMASEFITRHWIPGTLHPCTEHALDMIKNKTLGKTKKYLFGLFKIKESIYKRNYYLLGLRVYKIRILK